MTTKFLDNKIFTFKILLSWRFPWKIAFWTIFLPAPLPRPPRKVQILFLLSSRFLWLFPIQWKDPSLHWFLLHPEGPEIEKIPSRSKKNIPPRTKFSFSLEMFILGLEISFLIESFNPRPCFSAAREGPGMKKNHSRLKISFRIEFSRWPLEIEFFQSWGPLGSQCLSLLSIFTGIESIYGNEKSARSSSARILIAPPGVRDICAFGSWMSAPQCFSKVSKAYPKLLTWDVRTNGPGTSTGYPSRIFFLSAFFSFLNLISSSQV